MAVRKKQIATNPNSAPVVQQSVATQRVEQIGSSLEGKGKLILSVLGAIVALAILGSIIYSWQARSAAQAQAALGKAIEIHTAQVSASPVPGSQTLTFASEKERAEKAIAAFEEVRNKYGNLYGEKAQYFIAINRFALDRETGLNELQALTNSSDRETANLAKFALAEARAANGKYDEAIALYSELTNQNNPLIPVDTINFALASVYEKQRKKAEAADLYFNLAKQAREAKDAEGKPVALTATAREAATRLEKLDAAKFAQLPPEPTLAEL